MADPTRKAWTPEETASHRGWRFGATLDWASRILVGVGYPVELNRWWVDAVQGICQMVKVHYPDGAVPITHGAIARKAKRFKNKAQASELSRAALERNAEWMRESRMMIFDVEKPKPHEREGKDKRAPYKFTDYLTAAAVWAQDCEQRIRNADKQSWKFAKYRARKREEILAEAVKMLPQFESVEEMPASVQLERCATCEKARELGDDSPRFKKDCPGHALPLRDYVEQREKIQLAEDRRIHDKLTDGQLIEAAEIDDRLALLEAHYARVRTQLEKDYASTRAVLLGLRGNRLVRAMDFTDPEEVASEVESKLGSDVGQTGPATWLQDELFGNNKGKVDTPPSVQTAPPSSSSPSSGSRVHKGVRV